MSRLLVLFAVGCQSAPLVIGEVEPGDTSAVPPSCEVLEQSVAVELEAIQACTEPADCGQVLTGTSCGCTRDLVARSDADPSTWWLAVDQAQEAGCDMPFGSRCDCPSAEGFACVEGTCTWNYVSGETLPACSASGGDAYQVLSVGLRDGEILEAEVAYAGGCVDHEFTLCWPDQDWVGQSPVGAQLELSHDANGESCDTQVTESVYFDLVPLRDAWRQAFGATEGQIAVEIGGYEILYAF